jgi:hypothetical protein
MTQTPRTLTFEERQPTSELVICDEEKNKNEDKVSCSCFVAFANKKQEKYKELKRSIIMKLVERKEVDSPQDAVG